MTFAFRTVASIVSLTVAACIWPPAIPVSQATLDHIARCGGGLGVSLDADLSARVARDIEQSGALSIRVGRSVRATILDQVPGESPELEAYYRLYTDCVKGQEEIDAIVAEVTSRWAGVEPILYMRNVPQPVIERLRGLHISELSDLREYRLVSARQRRRAIIIELARIDFDLAIAHGESPIARVGADGVFEPPSLRSRSLCASYDPEAECPRAREYRSY